MGTKSRLVKMEEELLALKGEMNEQLSALRRTLGKMDFGVEVYKNICDRQERNIKDLQDRLLAKDLPELKTYELDMATARPTSEDLERAKAEMEEEFIGEVVDDGPGEER